MRSSLRWYVVLAFVGLALGVPVQAGATPPDPPSVDFGNVPINTTVERTIALTVDGGYRTQIASGGANPPFQFDFDTCAAGGGFTGPGTCTVKESFTPTSTGPAGDTLRVFECPIAGGGCIDFVIPLQGNGVSDTAADPPSVDFGNVPLDTTAERTITLTVDSGYRTEVASGGLNAPFHFDLDTCGAGGGFTGPGTCTVKESFTPTSTGSVSDTLHVFECPVAGGSCLPIAIPLTGNGVQSATTTALTSSQNPSSAGQSVTFTATVAPVSGTAPPTGTVTFADGATTLGTVPASGGTASLTTSTLSIGGHAISATYSGDGIYTGSAANLTQTVERVTTSTALTSSTNPSLVGAAVTFTASVTPAGATGTVTFADGATVLGTVGLSGGTASLTTSALAAGTHAITAAYSGDGTFAPSSANLSQTVQDAAALLAILRTDVQGAGPGSSLEAKVREVQAKLVSGGACASLTAFAHEVDAQRGKKLSVAVADKLLAEVAAIRSVIPC